MPKIGSGYQVIRGLGGQINVSSLTKAKRIAREGHTGVAVFYQRPQLQLDGTWCIHVWQLVPEQYPPLDKIATIVY